MAADTPSDPEPLTSEPDAASLRPIAAATGAAQVPLGTAAVDHAAGDSEPDIGAIAPERDAGLTGKNVDPGGSMLGRGIAGAALGHALVAALLVAYPVDVATWSGGAAGDGIDVDLISNRDVSVAEPTRASLAAAAVTPTLTQPAVEPAPAVEKSALLKPTLLPEPASDAQPLEAAPVLDQPREAAAAPPTPAEQPLDRPPPKPEPIASPTDASDGSRASVDRDPSTAGGATRPGDTAAATVSAKSGEIDAYKRQMVEAIDRCKPRDTRGNKGTVWISYVVDPDGRIGLAYIDQSSGVRSLDALALDALRGCRLSAPNPGLPREQRFYRIPFLFK